jgi:hypothetical protein
MIYTILEPPSLPLLGSLPRYGKDPIAFIKAIVRAYGQTARLDLDGRWVLLLNYHDYGQYVLQDNLRNYRISASNNKIQRLHGRRPVTSDGEPWAGRQPPNTSPHSQVVFEQGADLTASYHLLASLKATGVLFKINLLRLRGGLSAVT